MKKNRGFTLVELLVVMAIIAILASIVVPNVASYLRKAQMTRAIGEIESIELSLTKMLADANRTSLHQLFSPAAIEAQIGGFPAATAFNRAQQIYTRTLYALLREGRGALTLPPDTNLPNSISYAQVLDRTVVSQLGASYLDIGEDPWGNLYNIYPGPWRSTYPLIPFRVYLNLSNPNSQIPGKSLTGDEITVPDVLDPDTDLTDTLGFPADRNKIAFIWSNGENLQSSQAIYQVPYFTLPNNNPALNYDGQQEPIYYGGGDDVNNWDSTRSFERFYN